MMTALEQVSVLMTVMRQLAEVLDQERMLLRGMRLDSLADLQEEKIALADAYAIELRCLRTMPDMLGTLEDGPRRELEDAMRAFQATLRRNAEALAGAKDLVELLLRTVDDSLQAGAAIGGSYPMSATHSAPAADAIDARVIAIAFDRGT